MGRCHPHPGWLVATGVWLLPLFALVIGCGEKNPNAKTDVEVESAKAREDLAAAIPRIKFTDITAKAGIKFVHTSGAALGKRLLPETMGAGVAFCDFDNDGKPDLLFVNSRAWPGFEDKDKPAPTLVLYRNKGGLQFEDITKQAGLDISMYGMGVTVGDFDNDGRPDVFITGVGGNRLFRNVSDEKGIRFIDVTAKAGDLNDADSWPTITGDGFLKHAASISFPSSAAFLDYDNDGLLDLVVCNYVSWSPKIDLDQKFTLVGVGERGYGSPKAFGGCHCTLYRNKGDGTFENVSAKAGIHVTGELGAAIGKGLGVTVADVDEDGWPDIIVANDTVRNFFFHNQRDGTFKERGQETGIAYAEANARGAMGIDWGEYRRGQHALAIGNFVNEPNTLLRLDNPGRLLFSDVALIEGLAGPSRRPLKFGLFFFDFDLDGLLDLLTCNGHLEPRIQQVQAGQEFKQAAQLFWNTGGKRAFEPVTPQHAGPDLYQPMVGRGCAYADLDGDGYPDVVLTENGGPARLLHNEGGTGHHWVRLSLVGNGKTTNTSAIGARVILTAGGKTHQREVTSARGYLSQSEFPVTFGLGTADKIDQVEIIWPGRSADRQILRNLGIDRMHTIKQEKK